ncbi:hypothetical protein [Aliarcobacter butzleri]|uniref:hypothetical protein n=1 Tax=Aliarcobacter butzleri TaxID=28197 RepID=UPI00214B3C89|nr:hypothetical protein [Aliarcobacter butzleri]MCP3649135.1 hypothetical protein [Arcobacter sp. DNRA7]MCR1815309.1 hypothetical protein [Aliarcobacter butzleri]
MYSSSTGTKVDATLDTRLLTKDGQEQIKKEYEDMGENMSIIANTLPDANSDNPVESAIGNIWNLIAHGTLDILPSSKNYGGVLRNVPIWFGEEDNLFTVDGEGNKLYINGILNFSSDEAREGGRNLIGDDKFKNAYNPSSGILGDLIEAGIDVLPLWQTGISKQIDKVQNQENWTDIYLHSQGHLISQYNPNPNSNYHSYGAPMSDSKIKKIFNIQEDSNIQKNDGDPVAKPWIIFTPWKFITEDGHGTENYGASKKAKEQGVK